MLLVKFNGCWADEFDVDGAVLLEQAAWDKIVAAIPDERFECYLGTNESFDYRTKDEYLRNIKTVEVSPAEVEVLGKLFYMKPGLYSGYGRFICPP